MTLADGSHYWSAWSALTDGRVTVEELRRQRLVSLPRLIAHRERWLSHLANRLTYERAMLADAGGTVADRTGPEKGGACKCWASPRGGWSYIAKVNKVSVTVFDNWGNGGANFTRTMPFDKLSAVMSAADVQAAREAGRLIEADDKTGFFLSNDAPVRAAPTPAPEPSDFARMKDTLRAGVQVVSAPQLFPTPRELAERMADAADIQPGHTVLEPSAGLGAIVGALGAAWHANGGRLVAVEINGTLCEQLRREFPLTDVRQADFLTCNGDLGTFDRIVMNPPFERGADIRHIRHALTMLRPGGRLVALCANGPRQVAELQPLADLWEELPPGTFVGTDVRAALLVVTP